MKYPLYKLSQLLQYEKDCLELAKKRLKNPENFSEREISNYESSVVTASERIPQLESAIKLINKFPNFK